MYFVVHEISEQNCRFCCLSILIEFDSIWKSAKWLVPSFPVNNIDFVICETL